MYVTTSVTGSNPENGEDETRVGTEEIPDVHVSLAGEARCNGDEWSGAAETCSACGAPLTEDGESVDDRTADCPENVLESWEDGESGYGPHTPRPVPLAWANSASIRADEAGDRLTVAISVGDPRGAFTLTVERISFTDAETGEERDELRLSVPTPDDSFPHMDLTPLASPGYYRIGR